MVLNWGVLPLLPPPGGTFDNMGNIFSCKILGVRGVATGIQRGKTRIVAKHSTMLRTALPTKIDLASDVSIAEFEKPSSMQNYPIFLKWKK